MMLIKTVAIELKAPCWDFWKIAQRTVSLLNSGGSEQQSAEQWRE